jgi:hypothetical protein
MKEWWPFPFPHENKSFLFFPDAASFSAPQQINYGTITPLPPAPLLPTTIMKIFYAMLGAIALSGSAVAFTRQSAPLIIRRSTTIAMTSPIDFAKSEIASNDVS